MKCGMRFEKKKMEQCLRNKFKDPELRQILLATGDKIIVEAADYDRIWGIGYSCENESSTQIALENKDKWGENLLGKLLMKLRDEN